LAGTGLGLTISESNFVSMEVVAAGSEKQIWRVIFFTVNSKTQKN
jgi:hypothetical protein